MIPREVIVAALGNANVKAWLQVIRHRETDHTDRAYYRVNGRPDLTSLAVHPYLGIPSPPGRASGAYQDLGTTFKRIADRYPQDCGDFSQYAQDFGAVVGTSDRGALQDVIDGNIITACRKCHDEWTSLPGGSENTGYSVEQVLQVFKQFGGGTVAEQPAAPIEDKSIEEVPTTEGASMGAIAIPLLTSLLPQVLQLFSGRAQAQIAKATGSDPAAAGQFMQNLITQVGQAVNIPVKDDASAIQAVGALTALTPEDKATKAQELEQKSLDALAPILDKLHGYQKDEWAASDASQQAAFDRNKEDPTQNIQKPMMTFTMYMVAGVTVFVGGLLGLQVFLKNGDEPNGQLIILFVMLVTTFVNMLRTQNDWGFGSSRASAAKDVTIQRLSKGQ